MPTSGLIAQPTRRGIIPRFVVVFQGPRPLVDSARMRRIHNKVSKKAGRAAMLVHWKKHIPSHFKRGNRRKYDHKSRNEGYRIGKKMKFGSTVDLVKTGRTRDRMTRSNPTIRVGGQATSMMKVTMLLEFPFSGSMTKSSTNITPQQMALEIAAWTTQEIQTIVNRYRNEYASGLSDELERAPKLRKLLK